jgi:hypothetical protein
MHTFIRRSWRSLAVLIPAALCGCGPGNTLEGKIDGQALSVRDAVFFDQSSGTPSDKLLVAMSDRPNLCEDLNAGAIHPETIYFYIVLSQQGTPLGPWPGDYVVAYSGGTADKLAYVLFDAFGSTCSLENQGPASSGTVSLDEYKKESSGVMRGTFDLLFHDTDAVKGSFDVNRCATPAGTLPSFTCR